MSSAIISITKNLLNLIYPMRCASCGKGIDAMNESGVCEFCISSIRPNPKPHCISCGRAIIDGRNPCRGCSVAPFYFSGSRSACIYEDPIRKIISEFKYNKKDYLFKVLSGQLTSFVKDNPEILDRIDIITFVPLSKDRLRQRGFNQAELLARDLSMEFDLPIFDTLAKNKRTTFQHALSKNERMTNLKGSFVLSKKADINNTSILLVDDVITTGSTLNECSRVLLAAGAKEIRCLTLARGA